MPGMSDFDAKRRAASVSELRCRRWDRQSTGNFGHNSKTEWSFGKITVKVEVESRYDEFRPGSETQRARSAPKGLG